MPDLRVVKQVRQAPCTTELLSWTWLIVGHLRTIEVVAGLGQVLRVIIEGNRVAEHAFGTGKRIRMAVITFVRCREDHRTVPNWRVSGALSRHVLVPKLDRSAPGLIPVGVQVDEDVQASKQAADSVEVEVGVNLEESTGSDPVNPSTLQQGVRNQALYAGEAFEEIYEAIRVQLVDDSTDHWTDLRAV